VVALHQDETLNPELLRYINRLSDVFFVMARVANDNGTTDILWQPGKYHG
jgi:cob(I)alamin adenosyltransferase